MPARFTVLASGSSGNASLLEVDGFGLLIDCGLGPQVLAGRLAAVGRSWKTVSAVVLTHTHGDHWNALTLAHLRTLHVPLVAHPRHHDALASRAEYGPLKRAGQVRTFTDGESFELTPTLSGLPVKVPHDSDPTFAFRFEAKDGLFGSAWALGFASDVGHVSPALVDAFTGVDALAVEYNHDEAMQRASGRPAILVNRVLGRNGHLSNDQAADLTRRVASSSGQEGLRYLVQLHLSRDCNRPDLALTAGKDALATSAPTAEVITASAHTPTRPISLASRATLSRPIRSGRGQKSHQPALPGFDAA